MLQDLAWMLTFYIRFFLTYFPLLGVKGILGLHLLVRYHSTSNSFIFFIWFILILCVSFSSASCLFLLIGSILSLYAF